MPKITLNLTDVSTTDKPVPEGPYSIEVVESDIKVSKKKNNYLKTRLVITDGEHAKRSLWWNGSLDQENTVALGITMRSVAALLLLEEEEVDGNPNFEFDTDDLIGCLGVASVGIVEEGEFAGTNEVKYIRAPRGEQMEEALAQKEMKEELF